MGLPRLDLGESSKVASTGGSDHSRGRAALSDRLSVSIGELKQRRATRYAAPGLACYPRSLLSHQSQNKTLPGSKYVSRQRLILKLSAEIPVGFDCATAMPRACDNSKTASSRSGAGTDAEAVRRNPRTGARCMIFPIAAGFARNTWTSCTLICSNGNVAIQSLLTTDPAGSHRRGLSSGQ